MKTYDRKRACPKCRFPRATTEYHDGYHGSDCAFPEGSSVEVYWSRSRMFGTFGASEETKALMARNDETYLEMQKAIPEHFDRRCPNCKHLWAEAVA